MVSAVDRSDKWGRYQGPLIRGACWSLDTEGHDDSADNSFSVSRGGHVT